MKQVTVAKNHPPEVVYAFYGSTTLTRAQLRETLLATDGWVLARGIKHLIRSKSLGAGVYQVWLEQEKA